MCWSSRTTRWAPCPRRPACRRRGYLVITADKGMAGAYNHNVIKIAEQELAAHPNSELYVVGQVGRHYFAKKGVPIDIHFQYTAQNPSLHRARVIADKMLENYENGDIDEVYIIYTNMKSSVVVEPQIPLHPEQHSVSTHQKNLSLQRMVRHSLNRYQRWNQHRYLKA